MTRLACYLYDLDLESISVGLLSRSCGLFFFFWLQLLYCRLLTGGGAIPGRQGMYPVAYLGCPCANPKSC